MLHLSLPCPEGYIVICPWCFDCWARLEGQDPEFFFHRYVPCRRHPQANHPYGCRVHGSLLEAEEKLLDLFPVEMLQQEFLLTLSSLFYQEEFS